MATMPQKLPRVVLCVALASCQPPKPSFGSLDLPEGCQPLISGHDCFMPYPSDFFRVADDTQRTGARIELKGPARITNRQGGSADVHAWKKMDGFSPVSTLIFGFPADVSHHGFVELLDPQERSLETTSNTLIVEASTGKRVPHFVDLDPRATDPKRRALVIHPIEAFKEKQRYIVFVHNVTDTSGQKVPVPEGFRRLRDGESAGDALLEAMHQRYEDNIFSALPGTGIERKDLQLAWDFTVGSDASVTADMLKVRELTLSWLKSHTPTVTITSVTESPEPDVWREIRGTITGPLFLEKADPGSPLFRDAQGNVAQNGTTEFPLYANIPTALKNQAGPGGVLMYGHGFFGNGTDLSNHNTRGIATRLKVVMVSTDWWGMSLGDVGKVGEGLTSRPSRVMDFSERVPQAMANWLVLTSLVPTQLKEHTAFKRPNGTAVYQGTASNFIGCSQGHILGGVMAALNPDIHRAVLNVGGAGFTHLMMRARPFDAYLLLLAVSIKDPLEQQKYLASLQRHFDRFDPALYARYFSAEVLEGNPNDRRVLMQMGLGDVQVPNLGTYLHARMLHLPVISPAAAMPYGLTAVNSPYDGSALAIYDFGVDLTAAYKEATPQAEGNVVHDWLRNVPAALTQMEDFYATGQILNTCSGACNPE